MKVLVYSTRKEERTFLERAFLECAREIHFEEAHLNIRTAALSAGFDAVCVFVNDEVSSEVIEKLASLGVRTVSLRCAGYNNVDLVAAKEAQMKVVRVPAYSPYAVAEHAVALLLALNRRIHKAYLRVREGNFSLDGLLGWDVHGKTIGVVGTGTIGQVFCQIMLGFGARVLAFDPHPSEDCKRMGVTYVELHQLFVESDVLSLHCPLTPETQHLINEEVLETLKPGVVLVNTSRGGLVDTRAMIKGLKSQHIGGLALDVYEEEADIFFEDLSNQVITDDYLMRLTTFPNVIITGHQAFLTREALENIAATSAGNLRSIEENGRSENQLT